MSRRDARTACPLLSGSPGWSRACPQSKERTPVPGRPARRPPPHGNRPLHVALCDESDGSYARPAFDRAPRRFPPRWLFCLMVMPEVEGVGSTDAPDSTAFRNWGSGRMHNYAILTEINAGIGISCCSCPKGFQEVGLELSSKPKPGAKLGK